MSEISNNQAERAILYSFLTDVDLIQRYTEVDILDFVDERHKSIFSAMGFLVADKLPIDIAGLNKYLDKNIIDYIILDLAYAETTSTRFGHYLTLIKECTKRRKLLKVAEALTKSAANANISADEIILKAETALTDVSNMKDDDVFETAQTLMVDWLSTLAANYGKAKIPGISTGFEKIDKKTGGLLGGNLYVIAARPAMGKSALASCIAQNVAMNKNAVAIFSLEMDKHLVIQRMVAAESLLSNTKIKMNALTTEEFNRAAVASSIIAKTDLIIDDTSGVDADYITVRCRRLDNQLKKQGKKLNLIVVDYLQIMGGKAKDQRFVIEDNCRKMKILAKELNCPVILLSQLNRATESRPDKRPTLADLRDTGAIEQDADVVAMIYREDYYNRDTENKGISEVIFCKQRDGGTGTVKLSWAGEFTKFSDLKK